MRESFLALLVLACGCGDDDSTGGPTDGGIPSTVRINAAEGGRVQSPDGIFTLIVPPGAIAEDTDFSITIVPRADWPAELAAMTPIGEVYDVQPTGLTFSEPAIGLFEWSDVPAAGLVTSDGVATLDVLSVSDAGILEVTSHAVTHYFADGSVKLGGLIDHLSLKTAYSPLSAFSVRVDADAGEHVVGVPWSPRQFDYHQLVPGALVPVAAASSNIDVGFELEMPDDGRLEWWIEFAFGSDLHAARSPPVLPGLMGPLPLPTWRCNAPGSGDVIAGAFMDTTRNRLTALVNIGVVICVSDTTPPAPIGDHILVANTCRVTPGSSPPACDPATSGSTVEIRQLPDADRMGCTMIGADAVRCVGPSGQSVRGADPIELQTDLGTHSATFDAMPMAYRTDLMPTMRAFAPMGGTLDVRGTSPAGGPEVNIHLNVPDEPLAPSDVLRDPQGAQTEIGFADGAFDAMFVELIGTDASGADVEVYRVVPHDSMTLAGADRVTTLMSPELEAATADDSIEFVLFGPATILEDQSLFQEPGGAPESVSVIGAQLIEVPFSDLTPFLLGGVVELPCSAAPVSLTPVTGRTDLGVLCITAAGECTITNDANMDGPPLRPEQCATPDRVTVYSTAPALSANTGNDWVYAFASTGTDASRSVSTTPTLDADATAVVHRLTDGLRYRVGYRVGTGSLHFDSILPHTGIIDAYGQSFDAADTPRSFNSATPLGMAQVYVRICAESWGLMAHGNIESTPESEVCHRGDYAMALMLNASGIPTLDGTHPSTAGTWLVQSATAGTISADREALNDIPAGIDVTAVLAAGPSRFEIVFRRTATGFDVQRVTPM